MQFHTRTLLMVVATCAVVLALTTPGGASVQLAALASAALAWLGVLIAALVCDASRPRLGRDIFLLTLGFFLVVLGGVSACFCVGLSAKRLFIRASHHGTPLPGVARRQGPEVPPAAVEPRPAGRRRQANTFCQVAKFQVAKFQVAKERL